MQIWGSVFTSQRRATTPRTSRPTLFEWCLGSLTSHISLNMEGLWDRAYAVYSPYPWRLESLTMCRCNLLSYFKTLSDAPAGVELTTSRETVRSSQKSLLLMFGEASILNEKHGGVFKQTKEHSQLACDQQDRRQGQWYSSRRICLLEVCITEDITSAYSNLWDFSL